MRVCEREIEMFHPHEICVCVRPVNLKQIGEQLLMLDNYSFPIFELEICACLVIFCNWELFTFYLSELDHHQK